MMTLREHIFGYLTQAGTRYTDTIISKFGSMHPGHVRRVLNQLKQDGLIQLVGSGNASTGRCWGLVLDPVDSAPTGTQGT